MLSSWRPAHAYLRYDSHYVMETIASLNLSLFLIWNRALIQPASGPLFNPPQGPYLSHLTALIQPTYFIKENNYGMVY